MAQGGVTKIPISTRITNNGTTTYNNLACTVYAVAFTSTNGADQTVAVGVPGGVYVVPFQVSVSGTSGGSCTIYVPTSMNGAVNMTLMQGNESTSVSVQTATSSN